MPDPTPAVPRLAATVLIVRDNPFEVLMIRRRAGDSFGSALVFPGGVIDAGDSDGAWIDQLATGRDLLDEQRALRIGAIREVYEEAGLIVAARGGPPTCERGRAFGDALGGGRLDLEALVPFAQWITPVVAPKRFDTHFFLCAAPIGAEAVCDGAEAVAAEWAKPRDLLEEAAQDGRSLLFPTRMNLMRLAESSSVAEALSAARSRPIVSVLVELERRPDGIVHRLPIDAGYPVGELFIPH